MKLRLIVLQTDKTQAVMVLPEGRLLTGTYEGEIERVYDGGKEATNDKQEEDNRG